MVRLHCALAEDLIGIAVQYSGVSGNIAFKPLILSRQGAHYLLQTRTAVLNGELRNHFEEWYPELSIGTNDEESEIPVKMAA